MRGYKQPIPTRHDAEQKLTALIAGECSREEAADWGAYWVTMDDPPVEDSIVWEALKALMGADPKVSKEEYLYSHNDFELWLEELRLHLNKPK